MTQHSNNNPIASRLKFGLSNVALIIFCMIMSIILLVLIYSIFKAREDTARIMNERSVWNTVSTIGVYYDIHQKLPDRVAMANDSSLAGWRWKCQDLFEGKMTRVKSDFPHPYFSKGDKDCTIFALAYPSSPWETPDQDFRDSPRTPMVIYSESIDIPWSKCGDLVYKVEPVCKNDLSLTEYLKNNKGKVLIGFTDGTVEWLTGNELLMLLESGQREQKKMPAASGTNANL